MAKETSAKWAILKTFSNEPLKQKTTMKKNSFLWAALSMTAALVMTACTSDDNTVETPAAPQAEVKTIPYSVTVGQGGDAAATRATVDNDMKTLKFAAGDKLYVFDGISVVKGVLTLKSGDEGKSSGATFEGSLSYTGDEPAANLELNAVLVGSKSKLSKITDDGLSTGTYPTTSYCDDVATAVEEWSWLGGTGTYGEKSFTLSQSTAFLNFVITFDDGTAAGTTLSAVVSNNGSVIATADVTTKTDTYGNVVAEFVLPFDTGNKLRGATVTMGDKEAISFGGDNQKLLGKVYNVKRTYAAAYTMAANAVAGTDEGKLICTDGHIHAYNADAACTKSRVAKIIYIGSSTGDATYNHGLALALTDENSDGMVWNNAKTACTNKNTSATVKNASWMLPSRNQWETMGATNSTYTTLRDGFDSVDGTNLKQNYYWSSTEVENDTDYAWVFVFSYGGWDKGLKGYGYTPVRACLAF
jgi:hypothetical protein